MEIKIRKGTVVKGNWNPVQLVTPMYIERDETFLDEHIILEADYEPHTESKT